MKARWLLFTALILFVAGITIPYLLIKQSVEEQEGWDAIFWILVAPGVYALITWILWGLAVLLIIVAIIKYVKSRKRRRK